MDTILSSTLFFIAIPLSFLLLDKILVLRAISSDLLLAIVFNCRRFVFCTLPERA